MENQPLRAWAYARVSNGNHERSLSEQIQKCRQHAAFDLGAEVVETFTDHGVSGGLPPADRPAFGRMLERMEAEDADIPDFVVAYDRSRIGRDAIENALVKARIMRLGSKLSTPDTPEDSAEGRFFELLLDGMHQLQREKAGERSRDSVRSRRALGRKLGPNTPLGYVARADGVLVPHEPEQRALARARELRAEGKGWLRIARALDTEGHPARGARWVPATLRLALEPGAREKSRKGQARRRTERAKRKVEVEEGEHAK